MVKRKRKCQNQHPKHSNLHPKTSGHCLEQGYVPEERLKRKCIEGNRSRNAGDDDDSDICCKKKVEENEATEMPIDESIKIDKPDNPEKTKRGVFMNIVKSQCSFLFELQVEFRRQLGKFLPIINCKCIDLPGGCVVNKSELKKSSSAVNCGESSALNCNKHAADKCEKTNCAEILSENSSKIYEKEVQASENILKWVKKFQAGHSTEMNQNIDNNCSGVSFVESYHSCDNHESYVINNNFDNYVEENCQVKENSNRDSHLNKEKFKYKRRLDKSGNLHGLQNRSFKRRTNNRTSFDKDNSLVILKSCSSNYVTCSDSTSKSDKMSFDDDFYCHLQDPTYYSFCSYENCLCQKSEANKQNTLSTAPNNITSDVKTSTPNQLLSAIPLMTVKNKSIKRGIRYKSFKKGIIHVYNLRPRPRKPVKRL